MHGNGGRKAQGLHRHGAAARAVSAVDPRVVPHGAAVGEACSQPETRAHVLVEVEAQRTASDVGAEQHALLIVPVGRERQPRVLTGAADSQLVVLDRRRSIHHVLPVGGGKVAQRIERHTRVMGRVPHVQERELICVQDIDVLAHVLHAGVGGVIELDRPLSALGRHHNDAVAPTSAVDCRGGRVLEDVEALDVVGIDEAQVGADDAVDHDQGCVARRQGITAADADAQLRVGLRVGGLDLHPGYASRERLVRPLDRIRLDVRGVHRGDGPGEVLLALRAVADRDHRIQLDRARCQPEVHDELLGFVEQQGRVGGRIAQPLRP